MLKLARVSKSDVLYDLGCGYAMNLIVAAEKFAVRKCGGIEQVRNRCEEAKRRVAKHGLSHRIRIVRGDMDDLLKGRFQDIDPSEATVALYTIVTTDRIVKLLAQSLSPGCKLVYNAGNGIFPEMKPVDLDYPFYLSVVPFEPPISERDWLTSVLMDEGVGRWPVSRLWERLRERLELNKRETKSYRKRLAKAI